MSNQQVKIQKLLTQGCRHATESYSYGAHAYPCNHICDQINEFLDGGNKFSNATLKLIFVFLEKGKLKDNYYYSDYYKDQKCLLRNYDWVGVLEKIIKTHNVTEFFGDTNINIIICDPQYGLVIKYLVDSGYKLKDESIFLAVEKLKHPVDDDDTKGDKYQYLVDSIVSNITPEILEDCLGVRCKYYHRILSIHLEKMEFDFNESHLETLCQFMPYSYDTIKTIISKGVELTDNCLKIVCKYCDYESLKQILELGKFSPKKEHFKALITSVKYEGPRNYSRRYYYRYSDKPIDDKGYNTTLGSGYSQDKMELLIQLGYKPTYDDIIEAIKTKCEIPSIERFNIKTDKALLDKCQKHNFFPKYNFDCISNDMVELRGLCSEKCLPKIRSHLSKTKLVPDEACLENASKIKTNLQTVNLLIQKGGKVNFRCIENSADTMSANSTLMALVNGFKKNYKEEKQNYEKKIKELEKKIAMLELQEKGSHEGSREESSDRFDHLQLAVEKMDKQINSLIDKEELEEIQIDGLDESDESGELDEIKDAEQEKEQEKITVVTISDERIKSITGIPKQRRRDVKIPTKYAELFKLDKDTEISYISVKKDLIERINKNNWYNKANKQLVSLPDSLNEKLGLEKGYVKFEDIDKLVCLFYG